MDLTPKTSRDQSPVASLGDQNSTEQCSRSNSKDDKLNESRNRSRSRSRDRQVVSHEKEPQSPVKGGKTKSSRSYSASRSRSRSRGESRKRSRSRSPSSRSRSYSRRNSRKSYSRSPSRSPSRSRSRSYSSDRSRKYSNRHSTSRSPTPSRSRSRHSNRYSHSRSRSRSRSPRRSSRRSRSRTPRRRSRSRSRSRSPRRSSKSKNRRSSRSRSRSRSGRGYRSRSRSKSNDRDDKRRRRRYSRSPNRREKPQKSRKDQFATASTETLDRLKLLEGYKKKIVSRAGKVKLNESQQQFFQEAKNTLITSSFELPSTSGSTKKTKRPANESESGSLEHKNVSAAGAPGPNSQTHHSSVLMEIMINDRMGRKCRISCFQTDTIAQVKKIAASQLGTRPEKIKFQRWETVYKDHLTLEDYEVKPGSSIDLYYY